LEPTYGLGREGLAERNDFRIWSACDEKLEISQVAFIDYCE